MPLKPWKFNLIVVFVTIVLAALLIIYEPPKPKPKCGTICKGFIAELEHKKRMHKLSKEALKLLKRYRSLKRK